MTIRCSSTTFRANIWRLPKPSPPVSIPPPSIVWKIQNGVQSASWFVATSHRCHGKTRSPGSFGDSSDIDYQLPIVKSFVTTKPPLAYRWLLVSWMFYCVMTHPTHSQTFYRQPPQEVIDVIDAPPEPLVRFSPDGRWMLFLDRDAMPSIQDMARRMLRLAGMRIDPVANAEFQTDYYRGLQLRSSDGGKPVSLPLPPSVRIGTVRWSHRSDAFVFTIITDKGTELWLSTIDQPDRPVKLTDRLSLVLADIRFHPDGRQPPCRCVPSDRGPEPPAPAYPLGPNIQESSGNAAPVRTYQDLLTSPYDEALFEYYAKSQLTLFDFDGQSRSIGPPSMIMGVQFSNDGRHLLVSSLRRPFSYLVTYARFPMTVAVWDMEGQVEKTIVERPLAENIPIEGVPTGPRNIAWSSSQPATLHWFEALDEGDPKKKVDYRDRLMEWTAPFDDSPREQFKIQYRAIDIGYFIDPHRITLTDYDRDRRWIRMRMLDLSDPASEPKTLIDRNTRDAYGDPGSLMHRANDRGHSVVRQDGDYVYMAGQGATPQGDLPFLDRYRLSTWTQERLWRCEPGVLESPLLITESSETRKPTLVTRRESATDPPNYMRRELDRDTSHALTDFRDPTPQIRGIRKELVTYRRADGVQLSATLYLPANYQDGTKLPLMVWAYPIEFTDSSTAGQVTTSPSRFVRISGTSHLALLTQGYAVMDNATMPVVGDPETMNNTFVEQIVSSAQAAIDKAVEMGVADRDRVAVGGHSYGAFMTANLLAHSSLFKAGVARSGAYNRTLTPFGFQSERRPFWEAPEIYMNLSPFRHAHQIKQPLLLIHGENDDNSGTFPIQSQRMFQASKETVERFDSSCCHSKAMAIEPANRCYTPRPKRSNGSIVMSATTATK